MLEDCLLWKHVTSVHTICEIQWCAKISSNPQQNPWGLYPLADWKPKADTKHKTTENLFVYSLLINQLKDYTDSKEREILAHETLHTHRVWINHRAVCLHQGLEEMTSVCTALNNTAPLLWRVSMCPQRAVSGGRAGDRLQSGKWCVCYKAECSQREGPGTCR